MWLVTGHALNLAVKQEKPHSFDLRCASERSGRDEWIVKHGDRVLLSKVGVEPYTLEIEPGRRTPSTMAPVTFLD